jgi:glutaredoxin
MSRVENILLSMRQKPSLVSEIEDFIPVYNPQAYLVSKSLYDYNRITNLKYPPEKTYQLLEEASQNIQRIAELHLRPENVYREPVYCPEEGPADAATVVMLATSWGPYCAKARKYLQKREVPYCEYDIEHSATGEALHQRSGHPGIPVIFIDGRVIAGYDPDALDLALQQRRTKTAPGATERISFPPTPAN